MNIVAVQPAEQPLASLSHETFAIAAVGYGGVRRGRVERKAGGGGGWDEGEGGGSGGIGGAE